AITSIPIVFQGGFDPVAAGLVPSLSHPGGNITGITSLNAEVSPKRLELLHELRRAASVFALLVNPNNHVAPEITLRDLQMAAGALMLRLEVLEAGDARDLNSVFEKAANINAGGLVIGTDTFFTSLSAQLAALAMQHKIPAVYQ